MKYLNHLKIPDKINYEIIKCVTKCIENSNQSYNFKKDLKYFNLNLYNQLPRTHNGTLLYTKQNFFSYMKLRDAIVKMFKNFGLEEKIKFITLPHIRMSLPSKFITKDKKPYSTSKLHSDCWVGHSKIEQNAIIPVFGDLKKNTVVFYRPNQMSKDYTKKISNYDEGLKKYKSKTYLGKLKKDHFLIFNRICLHITSRRNCGYRFSIDFKFSFKKKIVLSKNEIERFKIINYKTYKKANTFNFYKKESILY